MANHDLQRWLQKSTQGLDHDLAEMIREELQEHYQDAVEDYVMQGHSLQEAHRLAMVDLGDEGDVRQGFRQVHSMGWRYLVYALIGLGFPIAYIISIPFNESLVGGMVFNLAIFLPMLYIVSSFRMVLRDRFNTIDIEKNVMLVRWGIIIVCITRLIGWRVYHQPTIIESYGRSIFDAVSMWEMGLNFASISGLLLASAGFIFIGEQALRLRDNLRTPGLSVIVGGAAFAVYGLGSLMGMADVCVIAEMIAVVGGMVATLQWSFIFWRDRQYQLAMV